MMLQQGLILLLGALALAPRPVPPPAGAPDGSVDPVAIRLLRDRIDRLDGSVTGEAARLAGRVLEEAGALEGSDPREGAVLLFDCASRLQLRLRENRLARPLFERAATLYERIGDGEGAARAEWHLADCYLVERRDEMALRAIAAARAYFETAGDPRPLATLARQEGEALAALGRMREGLEALDRAVRLAGEAGDRRLEGGIRYSRGCLRAQEGLAREGLQDLERARDLLAARESEGDGADFREVELALARAHLEGGRCDEAFEEARRCVRFFREHPVRELLARSLNVLAVACKETGRLEEAGRAFREVIDIRRAQGDEIGRAFALANRASLSLMQNRSAEALRDQMEAGRIFEEHHDLPNLAQNDLSTGTTLRVLGCNDEAARRLRRGLAAARKLGLDPLAAYARIQLGFLALGRKDYDTALDAFARADRFYERIGNARIRSTIAAGRAMTLAEQGDREAALREFERAEAGLERPRDAYSLAALGVRKAYLLVALDRDRDAVALLDSAWSFFEAVGDESRLARIEALRGRIAYLYGRDDEALDRFASVADHVVRGLERGIQPLGEDPAIEYRSLFEDALDMTVRTLTAHDEPSPAQVAWAYRTAQVFHGLGMAALLAEACRPSAPGVGGDLAGRYESALARLRAAQGDRAGFLLDPSEPAGLEERRAVARGRAEAERRVREADEALARVLEEVRTADPAYAAAAYPRPAPLERVREAIPEDGALIEFIETSSSTVAFVVTKRSTSVRVLGPTEEIRAGVERDVEGLRRALRAEDHEAQGERLRSLGRRIADPVIAALDPTAPPRILLVAPDGEIARVPMEALLLEDPPRGSDPREWSYLLGRFAVAYVHSGTAFLVGGGAPRRAPSPAPRLLAMGAPTSRTGGGGRPHAFPRG